LFTNACFFSLLDESDKKFDTVQLFEEAALQASGISSIIVQKVTGGQLTEFHLTESVDQKFLIIWAFDRNCVFSLDPNF
jgi:hypothetical protein